jgi:hypothetical protein
MSGWTGRCMAGYGHALSREAILSTLRRLLEIEGTSRESNLRLDELNRLGLPRHVRKDLRQVRVGESEMPFAYLS